jgi:hypothetical protein
MDTKDIVEKIPYADLQKLVIEYAQKNARFDEYLWKNYSSEDDDLYINKLIFNFDRIVGVYKDLRKPSEEESGQFILDSLNFFGKIERKGKFENIEYARKALFCFTESLGHLMKKKDNDVIPIVNDELERLWIRYLDKASADTVSVCREWAERNSFNKSLQLMKKVYSTLTTSSSSS